MMLPALFYMYFQKRSLDYFKEKSNIMAKKEKRAKKLPRW